MPGAPSAVVVTPDATQRPAGQPAPVLLEGQFTCRVCSAHAFTFYLTQPAAQRQYRCTGCSVLFTDPARFSVTRLRLAN